jgi:2-hydroxychromene-2-carboxylate isomerase
MGHVIYLDERRRHRFKSARPARPAFFFDVTSPLSYLMAERVERKLGAVDWVAADGGMLRRIHQAQANAGGRAQMRAPGSDTGRADTPRLRTRAEACARALRLPLVWPDRFPSAAPCAQRACAFACEIGAGGAFALAASRLAFCGGFDLEDPETLAEAAAAAGIALEECMAAAGETWRDEELEATARDLYANGITELPAIRIGQHWIQGESSLLSAAALLSRGPTPGRSLAPMV